MKDKIKFTVEIEYETEDDTPICHESMKNNLHESIENERINGALTPLEVSANSVITNIASQ